MIIYGSGPDVITLNAGFFFCPNCKQVIDYKHLRYTKQFKLYFTSVFQLKNYGEAIQCQSCFLNFDLAVLETSIDSLDLPKKVGENKCRNCGFNFDNYSYEYCPKCGSKHLLSNQPSRAVIFRKASYSGAALKIHILVDGKEVAKLSNNDSVAFELMIGRHRLEAKGDFFSGSDYVDLKISSLKYYSFEIGMNKLGVVRFTK